MGVRMREQDGLYRKKAETIEAALMTPDVLADRRLWPRWLQDSSLFNDGSTWNVATPEGWRTLLHGDWIIRDASGALFPLADRLFGTRYEPAS
jgi:hypothetical protein